MNNTKLSFVIPAFNEEKYIGDCLKSIYALQGLPPYEIIVADNNSTDGTREFVKQNFPEVKIVVETKKGPAAARNSGAKIAQGELIAFIDSDCRIPQSWVVELKKGFVNEKIVLLEGTYHYYETKTFLQRVTFFVANILMIVIVEKIFRDWLRLGGAGYGGDMVVKKDAFWKVDGFNDKFDFYGEDTDLTIRMMKVGKVKFDQKFWVYSSPRRMVANGNIDTKVLWVYFINTITVMLFGRVLYKKHKIIR